MRRVLIPLLVILIGAATLWQQQGGNRPLGAGLPPEALDTVELIQRGGPFPYRQDGTTFGNREGLLPAEGRGYYREYTVPTPGSPDRGARRIVTGGDPPADWYYTDDHYRSFRPFDPDQESPP